MAMSLALVHHKDALTLIAAFENGYASVHRLRSGGQWVLMYSSQAHTQPVLSLDVHDDFFITSSADSILAKHPIPSELLYPPSTEKAVTVTEEPSRDVSLLSAGLKAFPLSSSRKGVAWKDPLRTVNTKHSGQQGLTIRSDGRIFATAGWDSKVRVYSTKTMKELAVLKWHQVGCYAVAFSQVQVKTEQDATPDNEMSRARSLIREGSSVKDQRVAAAVNTHWIAAGAKDGKISLWDIY